MTALVVTATLQWQWLQWWMSETPLQILLWTYNSKIYTVMHFCLTLFYCKISCLLCRKKIIWVVYSTVEVMQENMVHTGGLYKNRSQRCRVWKWTRIGPSGKFCQGRGEPSHLWKQRMFELVTELPPTFQKRVCTLKLVTIFTSANTND